MENRLEELLERYNTEKIPFTSFSIGEYEHFDEKEFLDEEE